MTTEHDDTGHEPPQAELLRARARSAIPQLLGAIAALNSQDGVEIEDAECVAVSFPGFFELLSQLRLESQEK